MGVLGLANVDCELVLKGSGIYFKLLLLLCYRAIAQEKTEPPDPFRLDYKDVYENMHYDQPLRPQVHYTPITGQIGDPTGLVIYKGKYHLFYMYDEWSNRRRDNKNWGHATSDDCVFWVQEPQITNSLIDNRPGSGSGIVDWNNSLGEQTGVEKTMVVFYTDYGRGTSIAFSRDEGRTWIRHKANPVIPVTEGNGGKSRDANVFWYKQDQSWRLVLYEDNGFSFYKSDNLINWRLLSKIAGFFECPDIIQMPVDGSEVNRKWVLIDGNGAYNLGEFDGTRFIAEGSKQPLGEETLLRKNGDLSLYYTKDVYATQTWKQSYEGDGPYYQMASMWIGEPPSHNRTWSQQLTFPVELTLRTIDNQIKLCRNPINGIKMLRYDAKFWKSVAVKPGENLLENIDGDVFEIILEIDLGKSREIDFDIRGTRVAYKTGEKQLEFMDQKAVVVPRKNRIKLRYIIDRNSVEIFANQGEVTFTRLFYPEYSNMNLSLTSVGGAFQVENLEVYRLQSIWLKREQELGYQRGLPKSK